MPQSPSPEHYDREYQRLRLVTPKAWSPGAPLLPPRPGFWASGGLAGQVGAFFMVASLILLALSFIAGCASVPLSKVLQGAQTTLEGICEHASSDELDNALDALKERDLRTAVDYLKSELVANGHKPDVAALAALLESQLLGVAQ